MEFNEYQKNALKTATVIRYEGQEDFQLQLARYTLGIVDEAGEVAGKVKKLLRGDGYDSEEFKKMITKEMGDVLWYIAVVAESLEISMNDIAIQNIEKLTDRKERGKIKGDGDDR